MNRDKQLEYCSKCIHQKFDIGQGIICGLTNQKADFEEKCKNFHIDKFRIQEINKRRKDENKSRIAFGFSPKRFDDIEVSELTNQQAFFVAYEAAKKLNWNIGLLSKSGFIAYTKYSMSSWGEEIQIRIEVGNINIKSECTGNQLVDWGKNSRNIDKFRAAFNKIRKDSNLLEIDEKYVELSKEFIDSEYDLIKQPLSEKGKISGLLSLFAPTKGYFITPIIVMLNILIFVIMALSGVHLLLPSSESLLSWGANFRPLTIDGQWWRLITSTFIHIGILHLLMNMYALFYIGLLLEPYLGKSRFLTAYILAGISGSVASLYWHEMTISAGASGAIFGMYGVFIALLTTKLIEKSARKSLLISIGIFVVYNLANGLKGGIDNAAHIGGLISGLIIGYSFYPGLAKPKPFLKPLTIGVLIVLVTLSSYAIVANTNSDIGKYENDMKTFAELEQKALGFYRLPPTNSDQIVLDEIQNNGLTNWKECMKLVEKIDDYELPEVIHLRNARVKKYCELRIKIYETIVKSINEKSRQYDIEIRNYNMEIEKIISELTGVK